MPIATAATTAPAIMSHFLSDGFDDFFFLDVLFFVKKTKKLYLQRETYGRRPFLGEAHGHPPAPEL